MTISHRNSCCSCKALLFPGTVMLHPSLSLPVCSPCREALLTHDWDPEAEVCRCCLNNDSTLISCSSCTAVFCESCVLRLLGDSFLCLASSDSWLCLLCDSRPLRKLQLELLPPENTVDISSRYDGGRLRSRGLRSQRHHVRGVRGIGRGLRGRGRGVDGSHYEDTVATIGTLNTRSGGNRVSRVRRNYVARMMGNSIPRMGNNSKPRMRSNFPRRMGSNIVRRIGRNPTSYMTRRPVPNIVKRMTPSKDNSVSRLNNTLPDVQSPVPSVSDMDDGSFQCNNISSESTLHLSSKPQDPDIVDLSSDDDVEDVSLSHEGLAKLPPCINIVRLDQQVKSPTQDMINKSL